MNAFSIGPLILAADRASAVAGIVVFLVVTALVARRMGDGIARWSSFALLLGVLAARAAHVAIHWESFAEEPGRIVAVWQGGFWWPAGVAAACLLLFYQVREAHARLAGLASLAAGVFVWHVATSLTTGVEAVPFPEERLAALAGEEIGLADFGGKPMVVNLWASWCPPCRREMPMMAEVARASTDVAFVFANQGEDAARIRAYLGGERLDLPNIVLDRFSYLGRHYRTPGLPATLFIGADGTLEIVHLGEISREALSVRIEELHSR